MGIGDKAVSKWECGRGMPDNTIMLPLCSILDINVNELLSGESLSEKDYSEKAEDIIITLIEEKEVLKKRNRKRSIVSFVCAIMLIAVLVLFAGVPLRQETGWMSLFDLITLAMNFIIVLVMLIVTGLVRAFFRSFILVRRGGEKAEETADSLRAVKLVMTSFQLGGGLITILSLFSSLLSTEQISGKIAVSLLSLFYGMLFALILLPVKVKLEVELEVKNE